VRDGTSITYAALTSTIFNQQAAWFSELDHLGVDAYFPLEIAGKMSFWPSNMTVPSVAQLVEAWQPLLIELKIVSEMIGKPILFSEVGYQSRWASWRNPAGVLNLDPTDGSCWERSVNLEVQALLYEALLQAVAPHATDQGGWYAGVFWWLWRSDPTAGGTCDDSFVPTGKPSEVVLRRNWNGSALTDRGHVMKRQRSAITTSNPRNSTKINSAVFGAGQWSSPYYRLTIALLSPRI